MMFGCYRKDEAHDPETYCAAVAAVLSEYTRDIIDYVTDPRTGLPSRQKFLPNIAEIREALDARAAHIERTATYEDRVAEQLRLRDEWLASAPNERLKKMGEEWLKRLDPVAQQLTGEQPKDPPTEEQKRALIDAAKRAAAQINSGKIRLSDEARELMKTQDDTREHLAGDTVP